MMTFASFKKMILRIETLRIEILKAVKTASAKTVLVLLVFFFPTLNLNTMHIFYTSESSTILVTKKQKMHVGNSCVSRSYSPSDSFTTS